MQEAPFGDLLKTLRKEKRLSQQALAEKLGVHRNTIGSWEQGVYLPDSKGMVLELARQLGLDEPEIRQVLEASFTTVSSYWNVPFVRNPFFTGREQVLARLHTLLTQSSSIAALTQSYGLHGLGGIGKTQLAVEYAYRHRYDYDAVFWVQAETQTTLLSSFVALAQLLALPEKAEEDQNKIVAAVLRWLNRHKGWLLIFDNVEDLALLKPFLPTCDRGALLLTTRLQTLGTLAQTVELFPMTMQEGIDFLLARTEPLRRGEVPVQAPRQEKAAAEAIVAEMGGLPLALEQAGAYIDATQCSFPEYLQLFQCSHDRLLEKHEASSDHPSSVSKTFALAFERLELRHPAAAELLRFCTFLDPDSIPEELIVEGAACLGPLLGPVAADRLACNEAVAVLRSYSLVQRHAESGTLTTHRLVQMVLKDRMDENTRRQWAERALRAVHRLFPPEGAIETWPRCQRFLPHAQCCIQWISQEHLYFPEAVQLLTRTGTYLKDRARYSEAEQLLQDARQLQEQLPQPAYQSLAETLHQLGQLYFEQGRYSLTEACWQEALALQEEHQETHAHERARALNHLGTLYLERGRPREAEPLFQQALFLYKQTEPGHPVGIHSLLSQGWCYMQQGRYQEAEPLLEQTLLSLEQGGLQQLFIIHNVHLLGRLYTLQGFYQKAEECFQRGLALWEQLEFPHPCTARIFNGQALLCIRQGKHSEAEAYYRRAITFWEQLHFQYPLVSESLCGLALLLIERGNDAEAEPLLRRALHIREHWLGKAHPETLATAVSYRALLARMHREEEGQATPC